MNNYDQLKWIFERISNLDSFKDHPIGVYAKEGLSILEERMYSIEDMKRAYIEGTNSGAMYQSLRGVEDWDSVNDFDSFEDFNTLIDKLNEKI